MDDGREMEKEQKVEDGERGSRSSGSGSGWVVEEVEGRKVGLRVGLEREELVVDGVAGRVWRRDLKELREDIVEGRSAFLRSRWRGGRVEEDATRSSRSGKKGAGFWVRKVSRR